MSQERSPSPRRLGVESFDRTEVLLLVHAHIDRVSGAFREQIPGSRVETDVLGREVEATERTFVALQFREQPWTVVRGVTQALLNTQDRTQDARALSHLLQTETIFFGVSGEVGALVYQLYERGELTEAFEVVDVRLLDQIAQHLAPEETDAHAQLEAMRTARGQTFASNTREIAPGSIEDPRAFAETFLRERGAYVPALDFSIPQPGPVTVALPGYAAEELVRVDLVAL